MTVTFRITIVWDKNGQTRLRMSNVFKYAMDVKIDFIAVITRTDRLGFFHTHTYSIYLMEIYFLQYRQVEKLTKVNMLKTNRNRCRRPEIINTYFLKCLVISNT